MDNTDLPTSGSLKDENAKALTYRIRGIPNGLDKAGAKSLLLVALETQDVTIDSLAAARSKQVATIRVPGKPLKLKGWGTSKSQWQVSARGVSMTVDTHFGGFTPLHDPEGDNGHFFDCVAISGLGSHAFGSWKDRDSDHMWLRDALPEELPGARVMIYGYDSKLAESTSFQNLGDVASRFRESLQVHLGKRASGRPLIFIAHSLGGLVLKQAMVQMASGDAADLENLKATFVIFFFGVPNQGMDIRSLLAMVRGQSNLPFLATLDKNNGLLHELVEKFRAVFDFRDSYVISFFETRESPTARLDEGNWSMTGDPAILVDRYSAKSGRPWEDNPFCLHPINCSHSALVKFSEHDEDCEVVLGKLKRFAELAPAFIRARWNDDVAAKPKPFAKQTFTKSTPNLALDPLASNLQLLGSSLPLVKPKNRENSGISMGIPSEDKRFDEDVQMIHYLGDDFPPSPTPPMYHRHKASRGNQEPHVELRVDLDKTIEENYGRKRRGYLRVGVLVLTWEADELQFKATQVDKLRTLFEEDFRFEITHFEIPSRLWQNDLFTKVMTFARRYNSPECLIIIYYGEHAYDEKMSKAFMIAAKFETHDPKNPIAFFMDIQTCLNLACDQLLMLDCSFSEQAFAAKEKGKRRSELLTSTNYNGICPPPGRDDSFTRILVDAMKRLLNEYPDGFSTSRLYREIYQATRRSRSQPMLFYESRHDYSTIWLRPQAF